ncbi:ABC transporter substrate-binding protein [Methanocella sp. CWC-04]|uniref:ABC transporter substrate-binding protein n=1 Tax=Methanooceanicella nereidis TaxID=2052831 RepID=A0AAP2RDY8_9EURY|nr:aliphatic sulfonate ABC transporter substrate-binding protein [Methanocella sp. CWC-04]MCD1295909.1 ABC transporter substrate-binding protein [Methanocella sp. CWC-04]
MANNDLIDQISSGKISRRTLLKAGAVAGIGLAGVSFAGCTDNGGNATVTPTGAPLQTKDLVRVGYLPSDHDAPFFIAETKGYFDKYGINVEGQKFSAGPDIMKQISAGNLDMAVVGAPPVISYLDKDPAARIIAPTHSEGSGLIVKKGLGITSVAGLKGKKIAIPGPGSIQDVMLRKLLADNGISYDKDVNVVTIPAGQMVDTMANGNIDAAIIWEPFVTMAVLNDVGEILLLSKDIMPGHPCCVVIASNEMIQKYPDSVRAYLKAHKDAVEFINANLNESAAIVASSEWLNIDPAIEVESLPHMTFMYKFDEDYIAGTESFARELKNMGKVNNDLTRNELFDLTFVNEL